MEVPQLFYRGCGCGCSLDKVKDELRFKVGRSAAAAAEAAAAAAASTKSHLNRRSPLFTEIKMSLSFENVVTSYIMMQVGRLNEGSLGFFLCSNLN